MEFPNWTPPQVRPLLETLSTNTACTKLRRPVFERLVNDIRMQSVYEQFFRMNRQTRDYLYPAKIRREGQTNEDAQLAALCEVLQMTISAASDRMATSKFSEIMATRKRWTDDAERLRTIAHDVALAADLRMLGLNDPDSLASAARDLQGLLQIANWLDHLASALRGPDDPLMVEKHRGDPVVKGVQTLISLKLLEQMGNRLDGTAATLTSVALQTAAKPRASRSALTKQKPSKKRSPV
jgi:hypothetical protein